MAPLFLLGLDCIGVAFLEAVRSEERALGDYSNVPATVTMAAKPVPTL